MPVFEEILGGMMMVTIKCEKFFSIQSKGSAGNNMGQTAEEKDFSAKGNGQKMVKVA